MTFFKWSKTALSNTVADGTINWSEGQAPSTLNNSARAMMAASAKYRDDNSGVLAAGGSSGAAYTLTTNQGFTSLVDGHSFVCTLPYTNLASATIDVDGLGAVTIGTRFNIAIPTGALIQSGQYKFRYSAAATKWVVENPSTLIVGSVLDFAGAIPPNLWLLCYGQAASRTDYAALFEVIGTTYGVGDGSTTFNLPDLRGRVTAGFDYMGGPGALRLTLATANGVDGSAIGNVGGEQSDTLTSATVPTHSHSFSATSSAAGSHAHTLNQYYGTASGSGFPGYDGSGNASAGTFAATDAVGDHTHTVSGTTGNSGSGGAHNNVQPTLVINKIIFVGT